jgi:hypothetical protein
MRNARAFFEPLEPRQLRSSTVVGSWNFEDGLVPVGFVGGMNSTTPAGARRFLETAETTRDRTISLAASTLPAHDKLTISFDLYIINSWDGDTGFYPPVGRNVGPDWWGATVGTTPGDQQTLVAEQTYTTLTESPWNFTQSAPPPDEENTLGYFFTDSNGTFAVDEVYHLTRTFDHTSDAVLFMFNGRTGSTGGGESWGLDNVTLTAEAIPEPAGIGLALIGLRLIVDKRRRDRRRGDCESAPHTKGN